MKELMIHVFFNIDDILPLIIIDNIYKYCTYLVKKKYI